MHDRVPLNSVISAQEGCVTCRLQTHAWRPKKKPSCKYCTANIHQNLVAAHAATSTVVSKVLCCSSRTLIMYCCFNKHLQEMASYGGKTQHRNSEFQLIIQMQFGARPHSHCVQWLLPHRRMLLLPAYSMQNILTVTT